MLKENYIKRGRSEGRKGRGLSSIVMTKMIMATTRVGAPDLTNPKPVLPLLNGKSKASPDGDSKSSSIWLP